MENLLQITATGVLVVAGVQMLLLLGEFMRQGAGRRRATATDLALLEDRLANSAIRRQAEQDALDHGWSGLRKFEVKRKVPEGGGICSFYLGPHDGKRLPPFLPGQYLTFSLRPPQEDKPVVRCYSLSDSPGLPGQKDYYRVSIKKVPPPRDRPELPPGKGSSTFHDHVQEGDIIDVKAPAGGFYLDMSKHTPIVLIGGGVGITPVLSMLNAVAETGSTREVWFFYGVRNKNEHIMADHLRSIEAEHENIQLHICYSNPTDEDIEGKDYTHAERVSVDLFKRLLPSNNYEFYITAPPPMMEAVVGDLQEWGVPDSRIFFEAFGPASVKTKKASEPKAESSGTGFEVTFAKSGKTVNWTSDDGSLLDLAEENDISIDFGCRAGSCGTCITAVKSGEVEYLEHCTEPEAGSCLACVAQPKTALVVDA